MAMYTKMTSTGSSLIVNPRTISKELEQKIAASIAGVIARHDAAKLTTKLVRQAVEKDIHVSLTNHKELLKRLMHQEFRKIKAMKVAKRVAPEAWKSKVRKEAIQKGLRHVYTTLRDDEKLFAQFGLHALQTLYDLQCVETDETLRMSALYARLLGALWLKRKQQHASCDWATGTIPTAVQVVEILKSVFIVERLGISHSRRVELLEFFDSAQPVYSPVHYFGWNPAAGPPVSDESSTLYEKMANALLGTYVAHLLNVPLGCTFAQLFQYLPGMYPYKAPDELSPKAYRDQVLLVTTIVMVVTNFGSLCCEPELLPHEYFFLRHHLVYHLAQQDIVLVGETLRALKCFEGSENLVQVRRGMAFLLLSQQKDGSWNNAIEKGVDAAQTYFSTMNAIWALSEPKMIGFAPSHPEIAPLLEVYVNTDIAPHLKTAATASTAAISKKSAIAEEATPSSPSTTTAAPQSSSKPPSSENAGSEAANEATTTFDSGASEESLATQVRFLQGMLEKDGGNVKAVSSTLATHVLNTLAGLVLNVEILKTTGVGRVINKLRKHASPEVAKSATQLVAKWKKDLL